MVVHILMEEQRLEVYMALQQLIEIQHLQLIVITIMV